MDFKAILTPRAIKELLDAYIWYEEKQADLGNRFEMEVYKRLKEIELHPKRYAKRTQLFHETKIKTFPYIIIYSIDEERKIILISSIFHASRNPDTKYNESAG